MGLGADVVGAILKEHTYRSIDGDVLLIGRQIVHLSSQSAITVLESMGIQSKIQSEDLEIDHLTINRKISTPKDSISDRSLFHMLGAKSIRSLDCSSYEGAEIIHDLSVLLPSELYGIADFIVDGSTLDNVFDPALAIRSYSKLLRPGGRIFLMNMLSDHHEPYNLLPALWYLDYFISNQFVDCKAYIVIYFPGSDHWSNVFTIDLNCLIQGVNLVQNFTSSFEMGILVFAEKGNNSTSETSPIQGHYRSEAQWKTYRKALEEIQKNLRPHLVRSPAPISFSKEEIKGGHLFMNHRYEAVDPTEEIRRTNSSLLQPM